MLYDINEITYYGLKRKLDRKKRKQIEKLERQGIFIGKNPAKILKKTQKFEEENEDSIKDDSIRTKWKIAMLKAQGYKVKDDVSLLKKSADRIKKIKRHKSKKWQERDEQTAKRKHERQTKRKSNIQVRRDKKLSKKLKKARGRGRVFKFDGNQ